MIPPFNNRFARSALAALFCCTLTACFTPRVQPAAAARAEPRLEAEAAVMNDGARLPLRAWLPAEAPRAAILAVHGLNDYSAGFEQTGAFLATRGFAVYAVDQRGFGRTPQRGIWPGGDRLADDTYEVARLLRQRHSGLPLYALGESMGGVVLLHALRRHPQRIVDAVVLSAPAVWSRKAMGRYQRLPLRVLSHSWRSMKLSARMGGKKPSDDPAALRRLREDPLVIRRTRVDTLWGLANLMDEVTSVPAAPGVPTLVLYGAHDEIVPPKPTCAWLQSLRASDGWQIALYPSGWHLLTRDRNAALVLADLAAWLERPGSALPSGADMGDATARICALR